MGRLLAAVLALSGFVGLASCGGSGAGPASGAAAAPPADPPRLFARLGDHQHPITTRSPKAQRYFDQALILTFGFNHEAAVSSFQEAARLDPDCAMCFWGIALALGPNINAPMGPDAGRAAWAALREARLRAPGASPVEQEYIEALSRRYAAEPSADRRDLDAAYAAAMAELHARHPDDLDAATLYAESLMDLHPWNYYRSDGTPQPGLEELVPILEAVLERDPQHPGANHYLIHALEEYDPARAEAAADRLATVAPDAGHLVHMPSHIYWRVGRYQDAVAINQLAATADVAYFAWCRAPELYQAAYYNHNLHFIASAAAIEGRSDLAVTAGLRLAGNIPVEEAPKYPFLEDFLTIPTLARVRFGHWDEILGQPRPDPSLRYVTGVWHYARGLALVRRGDRGGAEEELAALGAIADDASLAGSVFDVAGNTAGQRLAVGRLHLGAEIAAAAGRREAALRGFAAAVEAQDAMNYIEPPAWFVSTRQYQGAALLEAGRAQEAERVYREDLEKLPKNGWSLRGLAASLEAQGRHADARWADQGFARAWARADVELESSRF